MEARLRMLYERFDPSKLGNIPAIVEKYKGRDRELFGFLQKKFNLESNYPAADPAFDFRSPEFDAKLALAHPALLPPVVGVGAPQPFDNINKCRVLLPAEHAEWVDPAKARGRTARSTNSRAALSTKKMKPRVDVFEEAATTYEDRGGPISVLTRYMREQVKIRVLIRRRTGVRGWCSGYLKAFDKHMNLFLTDVCEQFRRRTTPDCDTDDETEIDKAPQSSGGASSQSARIESSSAQVASSSFSAFASASASSIAVDFSHDSSDSDSSDAPPGLNIVNSGSPAIRRAARYQTVRRHLNQVLVRGDNVIAIHQELTKPTDSRS